MDKIKHSRLVIVTHVVEFTKMQAHLCAHEQRLVYYRPSSCLLSSLFHFVLSYSRDIVDVNVNDDRDDDDGEEQPAQRDETMKMQANSP